ncbi:ATP-binding cassette domain-containing protein, partial [Paraburkholderia elongata]
MDTILEMRGIQKSFGAVKALNNVNLRVRQGEIHAICGENGAGKSTLMKILSGVYPRGSYSGDVLYDGQERAFADISDSEAVGIIIIHQELALVPMLSITENIFLGNEQSKRGIIDWQVSRAKAKGLLAKVGLTDSPDA